MNNHIKRATRRETRDMRKFATAFISKVRKLMKKEKSNNCRFQDILVGSAKYNTILKSEDNKYDIDFQIILQKRFLDKIEEKPTEIRTLFSKYFNEIHNKCYQKEIKSIESSKSVITIITDDFSIDYAFIKKEKDGSKIIRKNIKRGSNDEEFTWNKLQDIKKIGGQPYYEVFKGLFWKDKAKFIEEHYLPAKIKLKANKNETKSSSQLFYEKLKEFIDNNEK